MKIILILLIVIVAIVALLLIIALFTKKTYAIERTITINCAKEKCYDYLRHIKNQELYSKWVMADPNMKKEFRGNDGDVGFVYVWEGNKKVGQGEQEIVNLEDGKAVHLEIRFIKPFEAIAKTSLITSSISENQTSVKWTMSSAMNYPLNIMLLFMNPDKMLGKDLELSLINLKTILEK